MINPSNPCDSDSEYVYTDGILSQILKLSKKCSNAGFHIATLSAATGVNVVSTCIQIPTDLSVSLWGENYYTSLLRDVDSNIRASEAIAIGAILLAKTATTFTLETTDNLIEQSGIAEPTERAIWNSLSALTPALVTAYTDKLWIIASMVQKFMHPVKALTNAEISQCIKSYALAQQKFRIPMYINTVNILPPPDILRCMGFAATAYGSVAMNFLEFVPRGFFHSDVLKLLVPGVQASDIIRQQDQNDLFHPAFLLVLDHSKFQIVLSIRGSMNMHDVITDLTCHQAPCHTRLFLDNPVEYKDLLEREEESFAHEGFLLCASALDILLREEVSALLKEHEGYSLLLCGHSLGAGVASLLTIKWSSIFPSVRCMAFSPPCVLSLHAARMVGNRITSVVIGDDVVCRLGLGTCLDLRDACLHIHDKLQGKDADLSLVPACEDSMQVGEVQLSLRDIDLEIGLAQHTHQSIAQEENVSSMGVNNDLDTLAELRLQIYMNELRATSMKHPKLYPPGLILHIVDKSWWESSEIGVVEGGRVGRGGGGGKAKGSVSVSGSGSEAQLEGKGKGDETGGDGDGGHTVDERRTHEGMDESIIIRNSGVVAHTEQSVVYAADQITFSEIQISGSMFSTHLPHNSLAKIREVFPLTS